tara:strand:+ start:502 stop:1191 length:690 start_codon:yes stop_codon:yes gene_type:complete
MKIQPNLVYSKNEVSELLNIHPRKLNRIAQRHNIEKVDNRYIFKGSFLIEHFKLDVSKGVQTLSKGVQSVSKDFQEIPTEAAQTTEALKQLIEKFTISEIQEIDLKLKDKGELSNIGNLWFVKKGVMLQEYTPTEYDVAFKRLTEWRLQQKEIEKQAAEITEIKVSSTERVEHYKNLFEYQRKQSDRILQIHEKLVGSLNELTKGTIQRNVIEAKEKGVINEDWKTTED